jgi:hypothetical protein
LTGDIPLGTTFVAIPSAYTIGNGNGNGNGNIGNGNGNGNGNVRN